MLFFILGYFLSLYLPNSPKNQNEKKNEKKSRDVITLHRCTKNCDQMMYGSCDMVHNRWKDGQTEGKSDI